MSEEIEPHAQKLLVEARHTGRIVRITPKVISGGKLAEGETAGYWDLFIEVEGSNVTLKYGVPASVGYNPLTAEPTTNLAKVCAAAGLDIKKKIKRKDLEGRKVSFTTYNVKGEKGGTFARITEDSFERA